MVVNPSYQMNNDQMLVANPSYGKSIASYEVNANPSYQMHNQMHEDNLAPSTAASASEKKSESLQHQHNKTYLVACIFIVAALIGLTVAIFVAFTNIRAAKHVNH